MKICSGIFLIFFSFFLVEKSLAVQSVNDFDVLFYKLDLKVGDTSIYVEGSASVILKPFSDEFSSIELELVNGYQIDSVLVNGIKAPFNHNADILTIQLPFPYQPGQILSTQIFYRGYAYSFGSADGIFNREALTGKSYTYTLTEPFGAKYVFPCKQDLQDKADSVYVFITTDDDLKAGSNGILENTIYLPDNKIRYEWKSRFPIDYYLISFAVGDYLDYSFHTPLPDYNDSVLIQNYIYNDSSFFAANKEDIDMTGDFMVLFSKLFGKYPFASEKYGHSQAPAGGGMEHQTMTTISNFSFLLVAHELAHQWFGDKVTCASWSDIWVNEGFASYGEYLAEEFLGSKEDATLWMADAHDQIFSEEGGSIYIPSELTSSEGRIFDHRLSYKKGAAIVHMIRREVNDDELFFDVLRTYLETFKDSVATGEDFKNILENVTGMDFEPFFQQWFYGEGYPKFRFSWLKENDTLKIRSLQESSIVSQQFTNNLIEFRIQFYNRKDTFVRFRQISNYEEFEAVFKGMVKNVTFDPHKWLLADIISLTNIADSVSNTLFTIAPNPVNDKINIVFKTNPSDYKIHISDLSGKIISSYKGRDRYAEINLTGLKPGDYILIIEENKILYSQKIIKI